MEPLIFLIALLFVGACILVIVGTFNGFSGFSEMRHRLGGVEDRQRMLMQKLDRLIERFDASLKEKPQREPLPPQTTAPVVTEKTQAPQSPPATSPVVKSVENLEEIPTDMPTALPADVTSDELPESVQAEILEPKTEKPTEPTIRPVEPIVVKPPVDQEDMPPKPTPSRPQPRRPELTQPSRQSPVIAQKVSTVASSIRAAGPTETAPPAIEIAQTTHTTRTSRATAQLLAQSRSNPWGIRAKIMLRKAWNWTLYGHTRLPQDTSVEFAVAANWLLRIGIIILVTSLGYFLKYSIDNNLLGPTGRLMLVTVFGLGAITAGCRMLNKKYDLLGQGAIGTGIAALYFAIFAAFHLFKMIPQYPAFGLMICVTALACGIAIYFNRMLIAILGTVGGLATPIMLSTGAVNFPGLYGYLTVLGAGIILISTRRQWYPLYLLGFVGIYGLSFLALEGYRSQDLEMFWQVFPFWIGYYLLFSAGNYMYALINRRQSNTIDILLMLANAALVYLVGFALIRATFSGHVQYDNYKAMLTLGLALHNILLVFLFQYRRLRDKALSTTAIALAAFFLGITMPLVLSKSWVTASWALEALVLLWVGERMKSTTLRYLAGVAYVFVFLKVGIVELPGHYSKPVVQGMTFAQYWPDMIERLMIFAVPIFSLFSAAWIIGRSNREAGTILDRSRRFDPEDLSPLGWVTLCLSAFGGVLIFLVMQLEFDRTFGYLAPTMRLPMMTILWVALVGLLIQLYRRYNTPILETIIGIVVVIVLVKLFAIDLVSSHLNPTGTFHWDACMMRLLDFGSVIAMLAIGYAVFTREKGDTRVYARVLFGWPAFGLLFIYSSLELDTILRTFEPGLRSGGLSILWSIYALLLILTGIWQDRRARRILGLVLFAVVSFKVYFVDLAHLSQLYRVAALFVLSLIIISGSFAYLKYRDLMIPKRKEEERDKIEAPPGPTLSV